MANKNMVYSDRQFLNQPGYNGMANIIANIERVKYDNSKFPEYLSIDFGIADCTRQITLTFDCDTPEERQNSLYKANKMVEMLTNFRDALASEFENWEDIEILKKEAKEKEKEEAE
jgi:hypothetical protein